MEGYGVWLRPHKQVIRNAEIPKGLVYYTVPGGGRQSRWIEKTFAYMSGA